jgi:hypothetical protein
VDCQARERGLPDPGKRGPTICGIFLAGLHVEDEPGANENEAPQQKADQVRINGTFRGKHEIDHA